MRGSKWLVLACGLWGCGGGPVTPPLDGGPGIDAAGSDGGGSPECAGQPDGADCGAGRICVRGTCAAARCGDGFVSSGEECDDGNMVAFDGCEPISCTFTCASADTCADPEPCNGAETCDAMHACASGTPLDDGADCTTTEVPTGVCRANHCVPAGCGNMVVSGAEDCDDGNLVDGDGCDNDCTFSCVGDGDCDDGLFCTGVESCDSTAHTCSTGGAPTCDDGSACTMDVCDATMDACTNPLIDGDMDGHAPIRLGACGDDCDDMNAAIYTGAEELCDGLDNNCNSSVDEVAPTWYIDCDGDGFAASTDSSRMGCAMPAASAAGCPVSLSGGWTQRRPVDAASTDCVDTNANEFPGQSAFFTSAPPCSGAGCPTGDARFANYDCNGTVNYQFTTTPNISSTASCGLGHPIFCGRGSMCWECVGSTGWDATAAPACGASGTYSSCPRAPAECTGGDIRCARGYTLVCVGAATLTTDPCYCPAGTTCTADCTPGERGCAWHYYRCSRTTTVGQTMGCR